MTTMNGFVKRPTSIYPLYRTFSSLHDNKIVMLTSVIDSIYNYEWRNRGILTSRKEYLQLELLVKERLILEPAVYYHYKKSDIPDLFYDMILTEASQGYLWLNEWVDEDGVNMIGIYKCSNPVDLLLLTALTRVILSSLYEYEVHPLDYSELKARHYAFLNRQENVVKVVKIELRGCMGHIPKSRIYQSFDHYHFHGLLLDLIKQIIYLPIYEYKSEKIRQLSGITPIGEISLVIMHYFLVNAFDRVIEDKYPTITYSRWGTEVILVLKESDSFSFNEEVIDLLLEEIDLKKQASIEWLYRDSMYCMPASNNEKAIFLYDDGELSVCKREEV